MDSHLVPRVARSPQKRRIESLARQTNELGLQRLDDAYGEIGAARSPDEVRSSGVCGDLYAWLVAQRQPATVVEFGSAFGVSGMYFAAGLEKLGSGHLWSFEINPAWALIAERNIRVISDRLTVTVGYFEEHVDEIDAPIDIAFVDGIHTYDWVMQQFEILRPRMSTGAIMLFDDIDFKKPGCRMAEAWLELAGHQTVAASASVEGHVGMIEMH
jgi:predicted O-methyltransferase YrrM